jgi:hypothetical protein
MAARRFGSAGHTSLGLAVEGLRGSGSADSGTVGQDQRYTLSVIQQTRVTLGLEQDLGGGHRLGIFGRYGFIDAHDKERSSTGGVLAVPLDSTRTAGHSAELGLRLRGPLTRRLFYGVDGALIGLSLSDSLDRAMTVPSWQRDRGLRWSGGTGLGYALGGRTLLSADVAGGTSRADAGRSAAADSRLLQTGADNGHFVSTHAAIQSDITRRLFLSASLLSVWQAHARRFALFPDAFGNRVPVITSFLPMAPGTYQGNGRYSDFGAGWRFSRNLFVQYVYSTDYGVSAASHTLMFRYTFPMGRE